jgi:uncharacterized glyoxalase superfamily protein PhnB
VKQTDRVMATIEVAVDPDTAFKIFTEEIDAWWERGPHNFYDGGRAVGKRFEPGVGGRYLEVYNYATGDVFEIGRITLWKPGSRLVYRISRDDTEVDIRFEAVAGGTRVVLEQRMVPGGTRAEFYSGWHYILGWFGDWAERQDGEPPSPKDLPRMVPILYYKDPDGAAEWLVRVFGLRPRHLRHAPASGELLLGESMVILRRVEEPSQGPRAATHSLYAYVDDLDDHFRKAQTGGASIIEEIRKCGDRYYIAEDSEGYQWTFAQARPTQQ